MFLIFVILFFRKLKLYEEQELTMQVFCEPESNTLIPTQATMERRDSGDMSVVSNFFTETVVNFYMLLFKLPLSVCQWWVVWGVSDNLISIYSPIS